MADKVPDYFEDPMDKAFEEANKVIGRMLKKYGALYGNATACAAYFIGQWEEDRVNLEEEAPPLDHMVLVELMKNTIIQTQILHELRQMNKTLRLK